MTTEANKAKPKPTPAKLPKTAQNIAVDIINGSNLTGIRDTPAGFCSSEVLEVLPEVLELVKISFMLNDLTSLRDMRSQIYNAQEYQEFERVKLLQKQFSCESDYWKYIDTLKKLNLLSKEDNQEEIQAEERAGMVWEDFLEMMAEQKNKVKK